MKLGNSKKFIDLRGLGRARRPSIRRIAIDRPARAPNRDGGSGTDGPSARRRGARGARLRACRYICSSRGADRNQPTGSSGRKPTRSAPAYSVKTFSGVPLSIRATAPAAAVGSA